MSEIKDNISKYEIIFNLNLRELFESSIRKSIKNKKESDHDKSEIKEEDNYINIKTDQQLYFSLLK